MGFYTLIEMNFGLYGYGFQSDQVINKQIRTQPAKELGVNPSEERKMRPRQQIPWLPHIPKNPLPCDLMTAEELCACNVRLDTQKKSHQN